MAKIYYAELWGLRQGKYETLSETDVTSINWAELKPNSPFYFFVPREEELLPEYSQGWKITDIFPTNSVGIVTARDELTVRWSRQETWDTVCAFSSLAPEEARAKYNLGKDVRDWKVSLAQEDLQRPAADQEHRDLQGPWPSQELVVPILYRPFDVKYTYYTGHSRGFICMPRPQVMRHMLAGENLGLITVRQVAEGVFDHAFASRSIVESRITLSNKGIGFLFPLYLYPAEGEMQFKEGRRPNLNPEFIAEMERRLGVRFLPHPPNPLSVYGEGAEGEIRGWHTDPELWAKLKPVAHQMRSEPTAAENFLWQHLRNRQLLGFKFRRQFSIERFIVDFYCAEAILVVEVEGPIHQYQTGEDQTRQAYLESRGLRLVRFSNNEVLHHVDEVLHRISTILRAPSPHAEREPEGEVITPEDIFNYAYAVFHSPTYRSRYAEFLKIDFPRLPLTSNRKLFRALAEKGAELVALHLMESPMLDNPITKYPVAGSNTVEKVSYDENSRRVHINKTQYFEGVAPYVWNFHIGGYQVCQKWLKDRKGRMLTYDDLTHYQKVVGALKETIRLMAEIDALISGWPLK